MGKASERGRKARATLIPHPFNSAFSSCLCLCLGQVYLTWTSLANTLHFRRRIITPPAPCSSLPNSLPLPNYTTSPHHPTQDRTLYHPSPHLPPTSPQGILPHRTIHLLHRSPHRFPPSLPILHNPHGRHSAHLPLARSAFPNANKRPRSSL